MAQEKGRARVAAIIPAFEEADGIAGVLSVVADFPGFDEVIVVDDGSRDATSDIAGRFPVRVIRHEKNRGKGAAMETGVRATDAPILFFCDADMIGFTHEMLQEIVDPVVRGETDMVIAMRNWRMYYARFILSIIPILGGQRALRRSLWDRVPRQYKERFMIETALNFYARYWGSGYRYKVVNGLTQIIKEKKYGIVRGFLARTKMFAEVFFAQARLQLLEIPATVKAGRAALRTVVGAVFGALFGCVVAVTGYVGPVRLVRNLFSAGVLEDPSAIPTRAFLDVSLALGAEALVWLGVSIVALNAFVILVNLKSLRFLVMGRAPVGELR